MWVDENGTLWTTDEEQARLKEQRTVLDDGCVGEHSPNLSWCVMRPEGTRPTLRLIQGGKQ